MTKKIGLVALGLSMALLSGCGSSDNDGGTGGDTGSDATINTPIAVQENIVGRWYEGCHPGEGVYAKTYLTFNADGTGGFEGTEYSSSDCTGTPGADDNYDGSFTYDIGEATTGAGGEDAVELDVVMTEHGYTGKFYTMVRFLSVDQLSIADSYSNDEDSNSDTPETREDVFVADDILIRQ